MLQKITTATAALCVAGFALAMDTPYRFTATVQVDHLPAQQFSLSLPEGRNLRVTLDNGLQIEFSAPAVNNGTGATVVRLVNPAALQPVVLHEAKRAGPVIDERTFAYSVCEGKVTFVSPIGPTSLACISPYN